MELATAQRRIEPRYRHTGHATLFDGARGVLERIACMTSGEDEHQRSQRATLARVFPGGVFSAPTRLAGGISAGATRWNVVTSRGDNQRVVVRAPSWDGGVSLERARIEARVLAFAADSGIAAPRLYGLDEQHGRLVLEFVEGAPRFTLPVGDGWLQRFAAGLRAVHRVTPVTADLSFLPARQDSVERMLAEPPAVPDVALREPQVRAALLARRPTAHNPPSLLHGDYWPGNVVWRGDELAAIIDWEEAEVGDVLADLSIARLDLLWAFGRGAMDRFTELYVSRSHVSVEHLPWWDLVAALRPMSNLERWASAYVDPPIGRGDITAHAMAEAHRWFVDQALARWDT